MSHYCMMCRLFGTRWEQLFAGLIALRVLLVAPVHASIDASLVALLVSITRIGPTGRVSTIVSELHPVRIRGVLGCEMLAALGLGNIGGAVGDAVGVSFFT
jgi:hypothetical protein